MMTKHLHNVVECSLIQMRNQGSCFQINTYCFKKKLNGKQCFLLYPLAVLLVLFELVLFFNFLTTGSACFLYTFLCIFLLLVENKFYIICFKLCHLLFFAMDIENKFYICSPCLASFCFFIINSWFSSCFLYLTRSSFFFFTFLFASFETQEMYTFPFLQVSLVDVEAASVWSSWRRLAFAARGHTALQVCRFWFCPHCSSLIKYVNISGWLLLADQWISDLLCRSFCQRGLLVSWSGLWCDAELLEASPGPFL